MSDNVVYSNWAYTGNEESKSHTNYETYNNLKNTYKITHSISMYNSESKRMEPLDLDAYDVAIQQITSGYGFTLYEIVKNDPNLSTDELALICDRGNLCFGYASTGNTIRIYTD